MTSMGRPEPHRPESRGPEPHRPESCGPEPRGPETRRFEPLRSAGVDAGAVMLNALRLLWRHWPVLAALYLTGLGLRELIMRAAVKGTDFGGTVGLLIFVLVPIVTLTVLVLMLRVLRTSLPALRAASERRGQDRFADRVGSILVPFVAAYYAYDYLFEDFVSYMYRIFETYTGDTSRDYASRLPFNSGAVIAVLVAVALVLRLVLGWLDGRSPRWWFGAGGAYVEVVWIVASAGFIAGAQDTIGEWLLRRRVVSWAEQSWLDALGVLGPFRDYAERVSDWFFGLSGLVDDVIVVPVAFLIVAAVVYGHAIAPAGTAEAMARSTRAPRAVRTVGAMARRDMRARFGPMADGLKLIIRAGLVPMLLFCLSFFVVRTVETWLWEIERLIIGPRELNAVWVPLSELLGIVNGMIGTILLACLLAAAVDRVLGMAGDRRPAGGPAPVEDRSPVSEPQAQPVG